MHQSETRTLKTFRQIDFISSVSWTHLLTYFTARTSLFRQYQDAIVQKYGAEFTGRVIELGCERHYNYARYLPNAEHVCTNIGRDFDHYLDITDMSDLADDSQDGFLCVSVLEHVLDFSKALDEIYRTLRPGGQLLVIVPFAFRYHDEVDYWRFSKDMFCKYFEKYDIQVFIHLGGKFSATADEFQKPRRNLGARYLLYKFVGFWIALLGKFLEVKDDYPCGYGIYAKKR
jgi:SAM-dependent methyltransferase